MQLKYQGPHTGGVFIPDRVGGDGDVFVAHGAIVEVDDELGRSLLEQLQDGSVESIWEPVDDAAVTARAEYWAQVAAYLQQVPPPTHVGDDDPAAAPARTGRSPRSLRQMDGE